jgi:hypothetical protein
MPSTDRAFGAARQPAADPAAGRGIAVEPITAADLPAVAAFLHTHLNGRVSPDAWARAVDVPWQVDAPNHGFMLLSDGAVVGAYLAFYAERTIAGRPERFCNLGAWCVLPGHRFHSLRLLKALLAQDGYTFTDLSPSGNVVAVNTRLKFDFLDTATALVPALPRPAWFGRGRISADPAVIEDTITGDDLARYRDHAGAAAARHLVLVRGGEWCYVVFRKDRRRRLPFFASILYASNPDLLRAMGGRLSRHLLFRHGVLATLAELRVVRHRPRLSLMLKSPRRKMFRSARLTPDQIDYLYSELVCVAW